MSLHRRTFLKAAALGLAIPGATRGTVNLRSNRKSQAGAPDVVVAGAGAFGMWTAFHLRRLGAAVTVVDPYGPANSRASSGGETRGVRSAYGDETHGLLWTRWAVESMRRWREWDAEHAEALLPPVFYTTGDLILREERTSYLERSAANWDTLDVPYEFLSPEEVAYRWPWIRFENLGAALYEPGAGVVRARRAIESVAQVFLRDGGAVTLGRASLGERSGRTLLDVALEDGGSIASSTFVFACGPWFPKVFPELMAPRIRTPMGHVYYFATPPGDERWVHPNMPSYGVPGVTGWPALGPDYRGFRLRTGGRPEADPDLSDRWIAAEYHDPARRVLERHFPDLADAAINETRACHYDISATRNFIIDRHPDFDNVWVAGGGSAEAFKSGPVIGEYIARRVMGIEDDPELAEAFRLGDDGGEDG